MNLCSTQMLPVASSSIKGLFVLAAFIAAQNGWSQADEKAWQLKQFCTVTGAQDVTFTHDRMRINNKKRQDVVIVDGKENTVRLYNDVTKRYFKCAIPKYHGPPAANLMQALGMHEREFATVKCGSSKKFGQALSNYRLVPSQSQAIAKLSVPGEPRYYASKVVGLWTFDDLQVMPGLARTLCRSYGCVPMNTIPCSMDYKQFGGLAKGLYTFSLARVTVKPSEFEGPEGYTKVDKEVELAGSVPGSAIDQLTR